MATGIKPVDTLDRSTQAIPSPRPNWVRVRVPIGLTGCFARPECLKAHALFFQRARCRAGIGAFGWEASRIRRLIVELPVYITYQRTGALQGPGCLELFSERIRRSQLPAGGCPVEYRGTHHPSKHNRWCARHNPPAGHRARHRPNR